MADYRAKGELEDTTNILCFYCASLYCTSQICSFYKFKVCGNPASSKSVGTIFPTAFAHFLSLCHILVILTIFQTFSLLLYLLWSSVVFDVTIAKRLQLAKGSDDG